MDIAKFKIHENSFYFQHRVIRPVANRDIIVRMHTVLDDYKAGRVRPEEVERSVRFYMNVLEALPYARVKESEHLCYRLVTSHMFDGEEEFIAEEAVARVLADFRAFLDSLPTGDAG